MTTIKVSDVDDANILFILDSARAALVPLVSRGTAKTSLDRWMEVGAPNFVSSQATTEWLDVVSALPAWSEEGAPFKRGYKVLLLGALLATVPGDTITARTIALKNKMDLSEKLRRMIIACNVTDFRMGAEAVSFGCPPLVPVVVKFTGRQEALTSMQWTRVDDTTWRVLMNSTLAALSSDKYEMLTTAAPAPSSGGSLSSSSSSSSASSSSASGAQGKAPAPIPSGSQQPLPAPQTASQAPGSKEEKSKEGSIPIKVGHAKDKYYELLHDKEFLEEASQAGVTKTQFKKIRKAALTNKDALAALLKVLQGLGSPALKTVARLHRTFPGLFEGASPVPGNA